MAVAVVLDFTGATLDQYDEVLNRMGLEHGGSGVSGGLFHWVAKTSNGIRVTDVWETAERFEAFAEEKIQPITTEVMGREMMPSIRYYEVHNYLTAGG